VYGDYVTDWACDKASGYSPGNLGVATASQPITWNHVYHASESAFVFDAAGFSKANTGGGLYFNVLFSGQYPPGCFHGANGTAIKGWTQYSTPPNIFNGYENVLFFDGHATPMKYSELNGYSILNPTPQSHIFWHGWRVKATL
jgi:prepilin-type processing-associated H-X9-DG protein